MTNKKVSFNAITALKDALPKIQYRKSDLRQYIEQTMINSDIVSTVDWVDLPKYKSVSLLIDKMLKNDIYQEDLIKLIIDTGNITDFSYLEYWERAKGNVMRPAKEAVQKLKDLVKNFEHIKEETKKSEQRKKVITEKINSTKTFNDKLEETKKKFYEIAAGRNNQRRGYLFEKFLNELFTLYDLQPKGSFKIIGEQIDGSFTFDTQDYLLEARWRIEQTNLADLFVFAGKIEEKLKNTLGLFVSIDGFTSECLESNSKTAKSMILMDGNDLIQILENRISLIDSLYLKRTHASNTGNIFYRPF